MFAQLSGVLQSSIPAGISVSVIISKLWRIPGSTIGDKYCHFLGFAGGVVNLLGPGLHSLVIVDPLLVWSHNGGVRPVGCCPIDEVWLEYTTWTLTLAFRLAQVDKVIIFCPAAFQTLKLFQTTLIFRLQRMIFLWQDFLSHIIPVCRGHSSMYNIQIWFWGLRKSGLLRESCNRRRSITANINSSSAVKLGKLLWIAVRLRTILLNSNVNLKMNPAMEKSQSPF